jgi:hypothetical protein
MKTNQTLFRSLTLSALTVIFLTIGSNSLLATAIPVTGPYFGELDISNLGGLLVGVSTTTGSQTGCVNFNTAIGGSASATCGTSSPVNMSVSGLDPIDFTFPSTGTIKNIPQGTTAITTWETVPSPLAGGTVFFDLTAVPAGVNSGTNDCTGDVGSTCVPSSTSPFVFRQVSTNQVQISFVVDAIAYTGTSASGNTPYIANFQTSLSGNLTGFGCVPSMANNCNDTVPNILNFEASGGTIDAGWHATESPVSAIPEPISAALFGSGLVGLSLLGRRLRRRS